MKITANSKLLLAKMSAASKMLPTKSPLAILNNFHVSCSEGVATVAACDGDNSMYCFLECQTEGDGSLCLDAKFAIDVCKAAPDGPISLEADGDAARFATPAASWETPVFDASQFPTTPAPDGEASCVVLPCELLRSGLESVRHAVSEDTYHPQLCGVCVSLSPDHTDFAATDTRSLALYRGRGCQGDAKFIIPPKTVAALLAVLPAEGDCTVSLHGGSARFDVPGTTVRSVLVKGVYPDYDRVIPRQSAIQAVFDRQRLANAVRRVALCADQQYGLVKLDVSPFGATLSCRDLGGGKSAVENIDCESDGSIAICFSARYLADSLAQVADEKVAVRLTDPAKPALILAEGGSPLTLLLMPMTMPQNA